MIRAVSTTIRRGSRDWLPRLTYLYFLREIGKVDAFLANVHFAGDPHSPTTPLEISPTAGEIFTFPQLRRRRRPSPSARWRALRSA